MKIKTVYHVLQVVGVMVGIGAGVITFVTYLDKSNNFFDTKWITDDNASVTVHQSSSTTTKTWSSTDDEELPDDIKKLLKDAELLIEQTQDEK